ncbi:glycosyl transferase family 8 protein [Histoplasma capsulatum H143]|uniref:glycogenin glucosyltransferase n=1 Tax=Ajellomyces capsulatus (strain H143) TaxID=544712 RepID=C6H1T3_AJECH|nr:glycosyl transferase family 8 protein [Histoplasma capsulatum H143]
MADMGEAVYCTMLLSDNYLPGAMVLAHSLRDSGSKAKLVVLVSLDSLKPSTLGELKAIYDDIIPINRFVNRNPANLYLMNRPDLISTFSKIELWRQTQYSKIVYIDADVVSLRAPNELLKLETHFAAVPDIGWPDCFNTGLMVLTPNMQDYHSLLALAQRGISFDGADQGLLNIHFKKWDRLSFIYNCTPSGHYQSLLVEYLKLMQNRFPEPQVGVIGISRLNRWKAYIPPRRPMHKFDHRLMSTHLVLRLLLLLNLKLKLEFIMLKLMKPSSKATNCMTLGARSRPKFHMY